MHVKQYQIEDYCGKKLNWLNWLKAVMVWYKMLFEPLLVSGCLHFLK